MSGQSLTVWCNQHLSPNLSETLRERLAGHRLVFAPKLSKSNLSAAAVDPLLAESDIALGQPDPAQCMNVPRIKWIHLTTAGYTRYDNDVFRKAMQARGTPVTNSSMVYAEPCAQHCLAYMLAMSRRLPQCVDDQRTTRAWHALEHRAACQVLSGQTVLILGFGAIAKRLVQLLAPLKLNVIAVRRRAEGSEGCRVESTERIDELLPSADYVMNILPANESTRHFMNAARFARMKSTASYYNIGRGATHDQLALDRALREKQIAFAYVDVGDPEPLPTDHPLWTAPNCYITPHTAGGMLDEFEQLVEHFLQNFDRFVKGQPLNDRVI